jgi:hypothetical protein
MAEIQHAKTFHLAQSLTGTDQQASDTHWHIAKQRAEGNGVMTLAGQPACTRRAAATLLTHRDHLCWNELGLKRRGQTFRLIESKP